MNKYGEYEALLEELYNLVLQEKKITYDYLLKWINEHKISPLTLYLLINDLKKERRVEVSKDSIIIDEDLKIAIPKEIFLVINEENKEVKEIKPSTSKTIIKKEKKSTKPKKKSTRTRSEKRKIVPATKSLLEFFDAPQQGGQERKNEEVSEKIIEEKKVEKKTKITEKNTEEIDFDSLEDENLRKALKYLLSYWSVGKLRFLEDLKGMKVNNPEEVLSKLIDMGYAERTRLGVINLKKEFRKKPKIYLSDFL